MTIVDTPRSDSLHPAYLFTDAQIYCRTEMDASPIRSLRTTKVSERIVTSSIATKVKRTQRRHLTQAGDLVIAPACDALVCLPHPILTATSSSQASSALGRRLTFQKERTSGCWGTRLQCDPTQPKTPSPKPYKTSPDDPSSKESAPVPFGFVPVQTSKEFPGVGFVASSPN